jgi:uncharacterized membrane protein YbhN (UPF0104 family)
MNRIAPVLLLNSHKFGQNGIGKQQHLQHTHARAASSGYIAVLAAQAAKQTAEPKMIRICASWLVRVGIATATLAGIGMMADPARKVASGAAAGTSDPTLLHALALFAIVWLIASLRIRRSAGRWQLGFDPLPVRRASAAPSAAQTAPAGDSRRNDSL